MSSEDDALIRSCLDSIKEDIEQRTREYELGWCVDALESVHTKRVRLFEKIHEEHRKVMRETVAATDKGYYYRWLDTHLAVQRLHPDTLEETKAALTFACNDLNLHDLPIHIEWFEDYPISSSEYRRRMLSQDEELFSASWGHRGFISWTTVTENGRIAINTGLSFTTAKTCLHELKHVQQRLQYGPEQPTGPWLSELERDADSYASTHYEMIRSLRNA